MPIIHKNILVSGIVQGVGFRYSCLSIARKYGIKGSVKNLDTGNVFIEAEGNEMSINLFIKWCYEGPPHAKVKEVTVNDSSVNNFVVFDIKH